MAEIDFDIPGPIGIQDIDVQQSFTKLKTNRTLLVCNLQKEGPYDPEIVPEEYTVSLSKLFEYGKPKVEVTIETGNEDDPTADVAVEYKSLKDFRPEEIAKRTPAIQKLSEKEKRYQKLVDEIERSKKLQEIIGDETKRQAFLDILLSIKEEIEAKGA